MPRASFAPRIGAAPAALLLSSTSAAATTAHARPSVASALAAPAAIRAGTYDLEIAFGGGVLEGRLVVELKGDSVGVAVYVGDHQSPVSVTARDGDALTLESPKGEVALRYLLRFDGDAVSGSFTYDGAEGTLVGKRRP